MTQQEFQRTKILADNGIGTAQVDIGLCYLNGDGVQKDATKAIAYFRRAAEEVESSKAQLMLGICYEAGLGMASNNAEAIKWYRLSAEQGNASAQYQLGQSYARGAGAPERH